jgi:hypothetical protein
MKKRTRRTNRRHAAGMETVKTGGRAQDGSGLPPLLTNEEIEAVRRLLEKAKAEELHGAGDQAECSDVGGHGPSCRVTVVKDAVTGKFKVEAGGCSAEDIEEVRRQLTDVGKGAEVCGEGEDKGETDTSESADEG